MIAKLLSKQKLWIVDCITGAKASVDSGPFTVGSSPTSDFNAGGGDEDAWLLRITRAKKVYQLSPGGDSSSMLFDGQEVAKVDVRPGEEHTVVVNGCPFLIYVASGVGEEWVRSIDPLSWFVYKRADQQWTGPVAKDELPLMTDCEPGEAIVMCLGMKKM